MNNHIKESKSTVLRRDSVLHFCFIKICIELNRCHCLRIAQPLKTALSNLARAVMATLKNYWINDHIKLTMRSFSSPRTVRNRKTKNKTPPWESSKWEVKKRDISQTNVSWQSAWEIVSSLNGSPCGALPCLSPRAVSQGGSKRGSWAWGRVLALALSIRKQGFPPSPYPRVCESSCNCMLVKTGLNTPSEDCIAAGGPGPW